VGQTIGSHGRAHTHEQKPRQRLGVSKMTVMIVPEEGACKNGSIRTRNLLHCDASCVRWSVNQSHNGDFDGLSYRSPMPRKWIPAEVGIEDPSSATCQVVLSSSNRVWGLLTAANSDEKLKKLASNKPTSSVRKWPPRTFVCAQICQPVHKIIHSVASHMTRGLDTYGAGLSVIGMVDASQVEPRFRDFTPGTSTVCTQLP
jgi:hypothetical protein